MSYPVYTIKEVNEPAEAKLSLIERVTPAPKEKNVKDPAEAKLSEKPGVAVVRFQNNHGVGMLLI